MNLSSFLSNAACTQEIYDFHSVRKKWDHLPPECAGRREKKKLITTREYEYIYWAENIKCFGENNS